MDKRKVIENSTLMKLGALLYERRKAKGWSQLALATEVDCSMGSISAWERGIHDIPLTKMLHLCNILNINPKEIV